MGKQLEIEKKYLVEPPDSWEAIAKLFQDLVEINRISQTYLKPEKDEPSARVRKTISGLVGDNDIKHHFNKKKFVEKGVHDEFEKEISKEEYKKHLKNIHPTKTEVEKTRFVFRYEGQLFELDVFKGALKGLAILEIELKDKKQKVNLPTFLKIKKEVTGDSKYSNFALAEKSLHKKH